MFPLTGSRLHDLRARLQDGLAGTYTLERELGRGGMAIVYLAEDLKHERAVALKVLRPELAQALGSERFLQEIQIAARLRHPHILPLYDSGAAEGLLFYVMPFIEGESLRERLTREQQLPLEDALQIAREVADALAYAHSHGVVHRDIKPGNILLEAGHAVVADFGIARAIGAAGADRLTETGLALGTPVYMSPEQADWTGQLDGRSDVYSLGCVLYEMLAGEPPYTGPTAESIIHQHLARDPPAVSVLRPHAPAEVARIIDKALAKTPADRFSTAAQLVDALARVRATPAPADGPSADRAAVVETVLTRAARRRVALGFGVGLTAVVGVIAALVGRPRAPPELDPDLVVIAPFDVLVPGLALWREGLVDVLSRNLDGAGPLRTVPPTTVIRR